MQSVKNVIIWISRTFMVICLLVKNCGKLGKLQIDLTYCIIISVLRKVYLDSYISKEVEEELLLPPLPPPPPPRSSRSRLSLLLSRICDPAKEAIAARVEAPPPKFNKLANGFSGEPACPPRILRETPIPESIPAFGV